VTGPSANAAVNASGKIVNTQNGIINLRETQKEKQKRAEDKSFILIGHSGPVYAVSISIDDKSLISCSQDCTIRLWSLQDKTLMSIFHGHSYPIWDLKFSPLG
jgi:transcription initiation factor TFIID subunit 5